MAPRIQIQDIEPLVDCGRFAVKACVGDEVRVEATIFRDGHEVLRAAQRVKPPGATRWRAQPLEELGNDRFAATFAPDAAGRWCYRVEAWVDPVASFQWELRRKVEGGQRDLSSELAEGALLLGRDELTVDEALAAQPKEKRERTQSQALYLEVDRELARFGAWYELFPRSWGGFAGVERLLPRFAELGFDVLYLPPVHPIGTTNRKGRNNALAAGRDDPGSPWAIGGAEGGHTAIHPGLGTGADFERLVSRAREQGIEIAIDYAIQTSPDHPWLKDHPEWFHRRPDGTLKYAENPPKRYQDIYNVNFDTEDREGLWNA
ncbi:MAG TPA: maltotransferase domain-containing protein, partial [Gaiellaceae bacterium]|nr:maltotransferase domain-containing protein [Gaiellaceae bacterium]